MAGNIKTKPDDTVSLLIKGSKWQGWQEVRITRGIERCPADFEIAVTERYPGPLLNEQVDIKPGDECAVLIGDDVVMIGFVDLRHAAYSAGSHTVRIQGRSKCCDLVDCAAGITDDNGGNIGGQMLSQSVLAMAQLLARPYGVEVSLISGTNVVIPQFNIILGETVYEVIEQIARYAQLLVYDDENGNLVLGQAGTTVMQSGFFEGVNVQAADVTFAMQERYSSYSALISSTVVLGEMGGVDALTTAIVKDESGIRFRPMIIVSEQVDLRGYLATQRANWELRRRLGRSQAVRLTCDSWRDSAGTLWRPGAVAPLGLPSLKLTPTTEPWVISEVSFRRDLTRGSVADVVLMPEAAFTPEPLPLLPFSADWFKALQPRDPSAQNPPPTSH